MAVRKVSRVCCAKNSGEISEGSMTDDTKKKKNVSPKEFMVATFKLN